MRKPLLIAVLIICCLTIHCAYTEYDPEAEKKKCYDLYTSWTISPPNSGFNANTNMILLFQCLQGIKKMPDGKPNFQMNKGRVYLF